ncbi:MAG: hypothetical protein ACOYLS_12550 [Polymorphobacter sp.]
MIVSSFNKTRIVLGVVIVSVAILIISIWIAKYLSCWYGGDIAAWTQSIGAIFAIVAGFATAVYQLGRQKAEAEAAEKIFAKAAYRLAHEAFDTVSDRLEAALTPRSASKSYNLRGDRTSEMVSAMRELNVSRLPPDLLADFVRLRSQIAAINNRLGEVYESEDRLSGAAYDVKRLGRYARLASAVDVRKDALSILSALSDTAQNRYGARPIELTVQPLIAAYDKTKPN